MAQLAFVSCRPKPNPNPNPSPQKIVLTLALALALALALTQCAFVSYRPNPKPNPACLRGLQVDRDGLRTLGVLTKLDLMDQALSMTLTLRGQAWRQMASDGDRWCQMVSGGMLDGVADRGFTFPEVTYSLYSPPARIPLCGHVAQRLL